MPRLDRSRPSWFDPKPRFAAHDLLVEPGRAVGQLRSSITLPCAGAVSSGSCVMRIVGRPLSRACAKTNARNFRPAHGQASAPRRGWSGTGSAARTGETTSRPSAKAESPSATSASRRPSGARYRIAFKTSRKSVRAGRPLLAAPGRKLLNPRPLLVGQIRRVALGLLLNFGHPATRRWGPHHKLKSRPNLPFNGFSNGL